MTVQTIRDRFLARTERVLVRVPLDHDAVADHEAALAHRTGLLVDHEAAMKAWDETSHSIADTPPAEPDLADVDAWIERADRAVDESSIVVVLTWKPKVYADLLRTAVLEKWSSLQVSVGVAGIYYDHTEGLMDGTWLDLGLTWDEVSDRLSEGEIIAVGDAGAAMANDGDAAPFKKRGKNSAKD